MGRIINPGLKVTKSIIEQHPELNGRGVAREVSIKLPRGLHSRPSARLAQLAQNFEAAISIISENGEADAKSMLDEIGRASCRERVYPLV